jgi:hypothetical protein
MQIWVRGTDGTRVAIDVEEDERIDSVKNKVQTKLGVPAAQQVLAFAGRLLAGGNLLDYGVQNECVINLGVAYKGG